MTQILQEPSGVRPKICFHTVKYYMHWCRVDQNLLLRVKFHHEIRFLMRSAFYVLVNGKHYFASRNQNFFFFFCFFFLEFDDRGYVQQTSVAASEVSS